MQLQCAHPQEWDREDAHALHPGYAVFPFLYFSLLATREGVADLSFRAAEVREVEQVLGPEEEIAEDAFEKFEQRLRGEGKTVHV